MPIPPNPGSHNKNLPTRGSVGGPPQSQPPTLSHMAMPGRPSLHYPPRSAGGAAGGGGNSPSPMAPPHGMTPGGFVGPPPGSSGSSYLGGPGGGGGNSGGPAAGGSQQQAEHQKRLALQLQYQQQQLQMQQQQLQNQIQAQQQRMREQHQQQAAAATKGGGGGTASSISGGMPPSRGAQSSGSPTPGGGTNGGVGVPRRLSHQEQMKLSQQILLHSMQQTAAAQAQQQQHRSGGGGVGGSGTGRAASPSTTSKALSSPPSLSVSAVSDHQERLAAAAAAMGIPPPGGAGGTAKSKMSRQASVTSVSSGGSSSNNNNPASGALSSPPLPPPPSADPASLRPTLSRLNWQDRAIYVARQLQGGSTVNGFLRSTAAAQRIKKSRARQVAASAEKLAKKEASQQGGGMSGSAGSIGTGGAPSTASGLPSDLSRNVSSGENNKASSQSELQEAEEKLKLETMNVRTAKKIKQELNMGIAFCDALHDTVLSILAEVDPGALPHSLSSSLDYSSAILTGSGGSGGGNASVGAITERGVGGSLGTSAAGRNGAGIKAGMGGSLTPQLPQSLSSATVGAPMTARPHPVPSNQLPSVGGSAGNANPYGIGGAHNGTGGGLGGRASPSNVERMAMLMNANRLGSPNASPGSGRGGNNATGIASLEKQSPQQQQQLGNVLMAELARRRSSGEISVPASSPGNPSGSTLRRSRKRKQAGTSTEGKDDPAVVPNLELYDEHSKRKFTKKEMAYRSFEVMRFRTLKKGDYVAARVSSRDLWLLSRVVREYPAPDVSNAELLSMTEAKRDLLFREKVFIQDVEEYDGDIQKAKAVARNLVLPLPRTYSEAADWGTRCKKGTRVYAMYPSTTSLYCGTVIDGTTYCRGDDDIIVVEFDGDEKDSGGSLPHHHIPARFVTLVPREFPASQSTKKRRASSSSLPTTGSTAARGHGGDQTMPSAASELSSPKTKRASFVSRDRKGTGSNRPTASVVEPKIHKTDSSDEALHDMINEMDLEIGSGGGLEGFEKLDFDLDPPAHGGQSGKGHAGSKKGAQRKKSGGTPSAGAPGSSGYTGLAGSGAPGLDASIPSRGRNPKGKQSATKQQAKLGGVNVGGGSAIGMGLEMYGGVAASPTLPPPVKKAKRGSTGGTTEKGRRRKKATSAADDPLGATKGSTKKRGSSSGEVGGTKKSKK